MKRVLGVKKRRVSRIPSDAESFGVLVTLVSVAIGCVSLPVGSDAYRSHCPLEVRFAAGPIAPGGHFRSVTDAEICLVAPGIHHIYIANSAAGPGVRLERLDSRTYPPEAFAERVMGPTEPGPYLVNDGPTGPPIEPEAVPQPDGTLIVPPGNYRIVVRYGLKSSWATPICVCKTASFIADKPSSYVSMD